MAKDCTVCKIVKPLDDFGPGKGRLGRRPRCRKCDVQTTRTWQTRNKERVKEANRRRHGGKISESDFQIMISMQDSCCAICGHDFESTSQCFRPHVDHCHLTGRIRGLLCFNCNTGLGKFKDSPDLISTALNYLS